MSEFPDTDVTLDQALELHRAGKLEAAAEIYGNLLEGDANNHDAAYGLGTVLMQQGELESALPLLRQAVDAAPDVREYVFNHACAVQKLGHNVEAAAGFLRAAKLAAPDASILVNICSKLMALGHYNAVAAALLEGSTRHPGSRSVWLMLARALNKLRDYSGAISAFKKALAIAPANAPEQLSYADLLFTAKQPAAAEEALDRARELGSEDPRAFYLRARCKRFVGDHENERRLLLRAIECKPCYGGAWQMLQDKTAVEELPTLAKECKQLANDPRATPYDAAVLLYTSARALDRLGDHDTAFETFKLANERQQADAVSRGIRYDKKESERFIERIRSEFDTRCRTATPTSADMQPVFIVGMPRSGTTLVERILGGLDGVTTGGECDALETMSSQYYWALDHGAAKQIQDLRSSDWDEFSERYWYLQTAPRGRLTDKMPTNFRHVGMICSMFPSAPIVYLRRDPRDVALSIYTRRFPDGHTYSTDLSDLAHFYAISQELMSHWKNLYPERIVEIEYERLVEEPELQSKQIAEFCGLQWRPECLDFHERTDASYTFSELQVREPLNAKGIGRWRKYAEPLAPFIEACIAHEVQLPDNQAS